MVISPSVAWVQVLSSSVLPRDTVAIGHASVWTFQLTSLNSYTQGLDWLLEEIVYDFLDTRAKLLQTEVGLVHGLIFYM